MRVILPFDSKPESKTYHWIAFPLGVIKANIKDYSNWLACKCINCIYRRDIAQYDFIEKDIWGVKQGLSETQTIDIIPQIVTNDYLNVIKLLEYLIQTGYYITGEYNEYYIPQKGAYLQADFLHDYIIWGCDNEKEVLYSTGYLKGGNYQTFEISYADYYKSIINAPSQRIKLWFHKINSEYSVSLNVAEIINQLQNYLSSVCPGEEISSNTIFGIDAWRYLENQVKDHDSPFIDLRRSRLLAEHKNIMHLRLNGMLKNGYLIDNRLTEKYRSEISEKAQVFHLLCIKYNLIHAKDVLFHAYDVLREINNTEPDILKNVLDMLQHYSKY